MDGVMYAVLSDVHGNLLALEKVVEDIRQFSIEGIILLGDLIDYGMQNNEVVDYIREHLQSKIMCSIWGNHEKAVLTGDYAHFSSHRGQESAKHSASLLSDASRGYLDSKLIHEGKFVFDLNDIKILAIHGSLEDPYWKSITPGNVRGEYGEYDFVLSGHSHCSHFFTMYYEANDPIKRNKHAVRFVNPGSVGQPRNHNPNAQYALIDVVIGTVMFRSVSYDIGAAMNLFDGSVDDFYRARLENGV